MPTSTTEDKNVILSRYIQNKLGLQIISPGDCKRISYSIEKITGKLISETTLKRFFGFAKKQYSFSKYTLNVICEYVGFESWNQFNQAILAGKHLNKQDTLWEKLQKKSMTRITLSSIKNLSGIPFPATVSRISTEADFDYFMKSNYQLFCLTGPAGIGKSIQIAHLADKFFRDENAPYHDSLVWLQKAKDYDEDLPFLAKDLDGKYYNIEKVMDVLEHFNTHPDEVQGSMVMIFDGYDNHVFDIQALDRFFRHITDILSFAKDFSWFKIIISLRAASWLLLQTKIDQSDYLRTVWFSGFFYRKEIRCNLFPLSLNEVDTVVQNICTETNINKGDLLLNKNVHELLGHPAYIHLYYSMLRGNKGYSLHGNALYCELIASFVAREIHQASHGLEKMWLIKKMLKATGYGLAEISIDRNVLFEPDEILITAYNELVSDGIFQEEYKENPFNYHVTVRLMEPVFYYFVATELLEQRKELSIAELTQMVLDKYPPDKRNLIILWVIISHAVKQEGMLLPMVFHEQWPVSERAHNIFFICDLIKHDPDIISNIEKEEFVEKSVRFLTSNLFIIDWETGLEARLEILLKNAPNEKVESCLLILLAFVSVLRLDQVRLSRFIALLHQLDQEIVNEDCPLNPLEQLRFLYHYYSPESVAPDFLKDKGGFPGHPFSMPDHKPSDTGSILSHKLAIVVATLCGKYKQTIAFSDTMKQYYSELQPGDDMLYSSQLWKAAALLGNNNASDAEQLMKEISQIYKKESLGRSHSLFNYLYGMIESDLALSHGELEKAGKIKLRIYNEVLPTDYMLLKLFAAISLIRTYNMRRDFEAAAHIIKDVQPILSKAPSALKKLVYTFINKV